MELAKQISAYCHVTYLISAFKVKELEHKGLLTTFNNSNTLDIIGLNDGNNQSLEFQLQDFQINLTNTAEVQIFKKSFIIVSHQIVLYRQCQTTVNCPYLML